MARKSRQKKSAHPPVGEKIAKVFVSEIDAPMAAISGMSHIEISGNSEAVIQGCQGILEYNENCIRLNLGKRSVLFRGTDLVMKSYTIEQIIVEGSFAAIEFG